MQKAKFTFNPINTMIKVEGGSVVVEADSRYLLATIEIGGSTYKLTLRGDEPLVEGERIVRRSP